MHDSWSFVSMEKPVPSVKYSYILILVHSFFYNDISIPVPKISYSGHCCLQQVYWFDWHSPFIFLMGFEELGNRMQNILAYHLLYIQVCIYTWCLQEGLTCFLFSLLQDGRSWHLVLSTVYKCCKGFDNACNLIETYFSNEQILNSATQFKLVFFVCCTLHFEIAS